MVEIVEATKKTENTFEALYYFPTIIYKLKTPEFLEMCKSVCQEYLDKIETPIDEIHPVRMSPSFVRDDRMESMKTYIKQAVKNILTQQGYDTGILDVHISDMWCQEHNKGSGMEQHIHGSTAISGFYFVDCPEEGSKACFYDPRPAKTMISIPKAKSNRVTPAADTIYIKPEEGSFIFANSWLPHSFSRNRSDNPTRFIHLNMYITYKSREKPEIV